MVEAESGYGVLLFVDYSDGLGSGRLGVGELFLEGAQRAALAEHGSDEDVLDRLLVD